MAEDEGERQAQLRRWFDARCGAATERKQSMIVAIPDGAAASGASEVLLFLQKEAAKHAESAVRSLVLDQLVAPHQGGVTAKVHEEYPHVPCVGQVVEDSDAPWCWALKMGYARDRVIACARVKAAELARGNLGACDEERAELADVARRERDVLRRAETDLARPRVGQPPRTPPSLEINTKRIKWARASADLSDAHRQQPTYLGSPVVLGWTAREIDAWAADPELTNPATLELAAKETAREEALKRDAKMGTETFVSLVFPDADHRWLRAAGATGAAIQTDERALQFPAVVTFHNATGALHAFPWPVDKGPEDARNAYVTADAAGLLAEVHTLIAREGGGSNYLLLEHSAL